MYVVCEVLIGLKVKQVLHLGFLIPVCGQNLWYVLGIHNIVLLVDLNEVPDYCDKVKHPMDFTTIKKKLEVSTHSCTVFLQSE